MSKKHVLALLLILVAAVSGTGQSLLPETSDRISAALIRYFSPDKQAGYFKTIDSDTSGQLNTILNSGLRELSVKNYNKAVTSFTILLDEFKRKKDYNGLVMSATLAGLGRWLNHDTEKALQYLYSALDISKENRLISLEPVISSILGNIYLLKNDTAHARSFLSDAWKKRKRTDRELFAVLIESAGEIALQHNQYRLSEVYFRNQLTLANESGEKQQQAKALLNLGLTRFKHGDFAGAVNYLDQSMGLEMRLPVIRLKKDALLKAASFYSFTKEYTKADAYHERYRALKDSLEHQMGISDEQKLPAQLISEQQHLIRLLESGSEESPRLIDQSDLELSRQSTAIDMERQIKETVLEELNVAMIEKREKENELLELQHKQAEQELELRKKEIALEKNKRLIVLLIAAGLIIATISFFIYNRYRYKKKTTEELHSAFNQLKSAQDQLIHSQKMASLGQITAGIAHEIQNPLNFVNNFSEISVALIQKVKDKPAAEQGETLQLIESNLKKINEYGKRASDIIKSMLLHSRRKSDDYQSVKINSLVQSSAQFAMTAFHSKHPSFTFNYIERPDRNDPVVSVIQQEISRVIVNLITNALQAMQENQSGTETFKPELIVSTLLQKDKVEVRICNNGPGIRDEFKDKIFTPFFTTKPAGSGTGLGLSISYDIITKGHKGEMYFTSETGKTCFVFTLSVTGNV